MKIRFIAASLCSLLMLTNVSFGANGEIVAGAMPVHIKGGNMFNAYLSDSYVDIDNEDTVPVYITMYLNTTHGSIPYGTPYYPIAPGLWHTSYSGSDGYSLNIQAACYPNGPGVVGGNYVDSQRFIIPEGICSVYRAIQKH